MRSRREVKTCRYGHDWYIGATCPMCEILGRKNLKKASEGWSA